MNDERTVFVGNSGKVIHNARIMSVFPVVTILAIKTDRTKGIHRYVLHPDCISAGRRIFFVGKKI
jgi:hypothetical protein